MSDVIDAIIAEALGEGPAGMAAVAHVIATRAAQTGKTPEQIVNEAGQFSGVSNPGSSVAKSMHDPAVRAQVQQIWNGVTSGQIPNPFPGADHFKTSAVNPSWAGTYTKAGELGGHQFYASGTPVRNEAPTPMAPIMRPASSATAAIESAAPSAGTNWLSYANQGATRSQPLSDHLTSALSFLPDLGVTMEVFSGGQPGKGEGPRVGSTRHDHGDAADVFFYKDGKQLDWANPSDLPIFEQIVQQGKAAGITGFGAGEGYMRPGSMHLGFGSPSVWGAGGKGTNAPDWLRNAYSGAPVAPHAVAPKPTLFGMIGNGITGATNALGQAAKPLMVKAGAVAQSAIPGAVASSLGTVAGRSALLRYLSNQNVAKAPVMVAGARPGGTQVMTTNGQPGTLMRAANGQVGGESSRAFDAQYHPGQNMDVYRANAAAAGGAGNLNQAGINAALMRGATLVRENGGGGGSRSEDAASRVNGRG